MNRQITAKHKPEDREDNSSIKRLIAMWPNLLFPSLDLVHISIIISRISMNLAMCPWWRRVAIQGNDAI